MIKFEEIDKNHIIISGTSFFWFSKRLVDLFISFLLLPTFILTVVILVSLNFFYNKGPVFFIQKRMGKHCKSFYAIKFRTMISTKVINRKHDDPLEVERITKLGKIMRKIRLDELPQIINVIKGDMSLIGPRPDYYNHALIYLDNIPNYRNRHAIRPGISGLSQIRLGYAEGLNATKKKSKIDVYYIENVNIYLEIKIFFGTIITVLKGIGL